MFEVNYFSSFVNKKECSDMHTCTRLCCNWNVSTWEIAEGVVLQEELSLGQLLISQLITTLFTWRDVWLAS